MLPTRRRHGDSALVEAQPRRSVRVRLTGLLAPMSTSRAFHGPNQPWRWPSWIVLSPTDRQELAERLNAAEVLVWQADAALRRCFQCMRPLIETDQNGSNASLLAVLINESLCCLLDALRKPQAAPSEDAGPCNGSNGSGKNCAMNRNNSPKSGRWTSWQPPVEWEGLASSSIPDCSQPSPAALSSALPSRIGRPAAHRSSGTDDHRRRAGLRVLHGPVLFQRVSAAFRLPAGHLPQEGRQRERLIPPLSGGCLSNNHTGWGEGNWPLAAFVRRQRHVRVC